MNLIKIFAFCAAVALSLQSAFAQGSPSVEMADSFRADGKIYVVVLGLVIILTGVLLFLIRVDRKLSILQKKIENSEKK